MTIISLFLSKYFPSYSSESLQSLDISKEIFRNSKPEPVDMSGPVATLVKELIASDLVVIFSKTYCPYCTMAKEVFDKLNQKFTTIELDKRDDGDSIQAVLGEITGAKTVPRVFVKGECIGGGSDCKALFEGGKLQAMLA